MNKDKVLSTIIVTIFIVLFMIFMIRLLPVNLAESIVAMVNSISNPELEAEGAIIYYGFASFSIGIVIIGHYILAGFILVASLIFLAIAVHHRCSENKWVR